MYFTSTAQLWRMYESINTYVCMHMLHTHQSHASHMTGHHNIHAPMDGPFHLPVLYSYSKPSVNSIYHLVQIIIDWHPLLWITDNCCRLLSNRIHYGRLFPYYWPRCDSHIHMARVLCVCYLTVVWTAVIT